MIDQVQLTALAKGRIERSNRTMQDRAIAEMRLAGINDFHNANAFLKNYITKEWKKRFAVKAANPAAAFKPIPIDKNIKQVCSVKEHREVKRDSTISFKNVIYILEHKFNDPKITSDHAEIRRYPDGTWSVYVNDRAVNLVVAPANRQPDPKYIQKIEQGNDSVRFNNKIVLKAG